MDKVIELQFGQFEDAQREIIPVDKIESIYVELPDALNIVIRIYGMPNNLREYYPDRVQCNRRWREIRKIMGVDNQIGVGKGNPIPVDLDEWNSFGKEFQNEYHKNHRHSIFYPPKEGETA